MANYRISVILWMLSACGSHYSGNIILSIRYRGEEVMAAALRECTASAQATFAPKNCTVRVLYNDSSLPESCRNNWNVRNGIFILYPVCSQESELIVRSDQGHDLNLEAELSCYYDILTVTSMEPSADVCVPGEIQNSLGQCREHLRSRKYIVYADLRMLERARVASGQIPP
jgi:hypothetical protein